MSAIEVKPTRKHLASLNDFTPCTLSFFSLIRSLFSQIFPPFFLRAFETESSRERKSFLSRFSKKKEKEKEKEKEEKKKGVF